MKHTHPAAPLADWGDQGNSRADQERAGGDRPKHVGWERGFEGRRRRHAALQLPEALLALRHAFWCERGTPALTAVDSCSLPSMHSAPSHAACWLAPRRPPSVPPQPMPAQQLVQPSALAQSALRPAPCTLLLTQGPASLHPAPAPALCVHPLQGGQLVLSAKRGGGGPQGAQRSGGSGIVTMGGWECEVERFVQTGGCSACVRAPGGNATRSACCGCMPFQRGASPPQPPIRKHSTTHLPL